MGAASVEKTALVNRRNIVEVRDLEVKFRLQSMLLRRTLGWVQAVRGVSFSLASGESLGIVGESGCGKSTLAECIVRLIQPTDGCIIFDGEEITHAQRSTLRRFRRDVQLVSQDPFDSLNPRMTVRQLIREPLQVHSIGSSKEQNARVEELCEAVGLDVSVIDRRPTTFSGGQRQRVVIARALAPGPKLLVLDEPVSALDISVQAQILNLLNELREKYAVSYIFIGHDLAVVKQVCDRIAVMYLGKIMEIGRSDEVLESPTHPYTRTLLDAVSSLEPTNETGFGTIGQYKGEIPSPKNPPSGCGFRTRCSIADGRCAEIVPALNEVAPSRSTACHYPINSEESSPSESRSSKSPVLGGRD